MRFISYHEIEQGLICDGVEVVVVCKFCVGDLIGLETQVTSVEDSKVHFYLLVDTFCFTVRLRMVCGGKR